jgi:hypothetical protein
VTSESTLVQTKTAFILPRLFHGCNAKHINKYCMFCITAAEQPWEYKRSLTLKSFCSSKLLSIFHESYHNVDLGEWSCVIEIGSRIAQAKTERIKMKMKV